MPLINSGTVKKTKAGQILAGQKPMLNVAEEGRTATVNEDNLGSYNGIGSGPAPDTSAVDQMETNARTRQEAIDEAIRSKQERGGRGEGGEGTAPGAQAGSYLDPESEAWLRDLFQPVDTAAQEEQARANSEAALGRSKADLEARGGMAGMGLAGGQIAMGADLQNASAQQLTDQILGIQGDARKENLQRGTVAADFLDRGVGRSLEGAEIAKDDAMTMAVLGQMGLKPVYDEQGNLTSFEQMTPDGVDPTLTDDDPTNDADALARQNEENLAQYSGLPTGNSSIGGGEEIARYTDEGGTIWVIYQKEDGTQYRSSGNIIKDTVGG